MELANLISEFCREAGCEPITCDEYGVYRVDIDDAVVAFAEANGCLYYYGEVGRLPEKGRDIVYRVALEAMYPCNENELNGALFAMKPEDDVLVLYRREASSAVDLPVFCEQMRSLAKLVIECRGYLEDFIKAGCVIPEESSEDEKNRMANFFKFV